MCLLRSDIFVFNIGEVVIVRQVQVVVSAGSEEEIGRERSGPGNKTGFLARFFNRKVLPAKMWSSRNQMLTDNDGDDVAFLSGSGDVRLGIVFSIVLFKHDFPK